MQDSGLKLTNLERSSTLTIDDISFFVTNPHSFSSTSCQGIFLEIITGTPDAKDSIVDIEKLS